MLVLNGENLKLEQVWQASLLESAAVELHPEARARVRKARSYIESRLDQGEVIYGVNTGFGAFSSVRISAQDIVQLQRNLIRSHSSGVGQPFDRFHRLPWRVERAPHLGCLR